MFGKMKDIKVRISVVILNVVTAMKATQKIQPFLQKKN